MPPLPADSIHARACKLKCEKILTRPACSTVIRDSAAEDVVARVSIIVKAKIEDKNFCKIIKLSYFTNFTSW